MKRIIFALSVLVLGFGIFGVSVWRGRVSTLSIAAEGQEKVMLEENTESEESKIVEEREDYSLPYTGILPDHPLYFLKMIRDRIQLWLTRDTLKRADLLLHYADKRISASLDLAEKGKAGLAVTTATKAEKYLDRSLTEVMNLDSSDSEVVELYRKLYMASFKHKLVIFGIRSRIPTETTDVLNSMEQICNRVMQEADGVGGFSTEFEKKIEIEPEMMVGEMKESTKEASFE